jgi:hypothetical protein
MSITNNIYNILSKINSLTESTKPAETAAETVYENVEPRGSITEAVKSLEAKFATFKEAKAKPDFLDVDKDGDKKEPFKKAVKDKKDNKGWTPERIAAMKQKGSWDGQVEEGTIAKPKKDLKKHSATAKRMAMQKKADKGHEEWLDNLEKTDPDHPSLKYRKQATNEGAGPYTLDDPKHPKFKANYEKYKKAHPDCTLAEFVAAMRKKEKGLAEGQSVSRKSADFTTWVLQQGDKFKDFTKNPDTYAAAQKAYKAAQKTMSEGIDDLTDLDDYQFAEPDTDTAVKPATAKQAAAERRRRLQDLEDRKAEKDDWFSGNDKEPNVRVHRAKYQDEPELDEVAPPGAKAERMVKHIKKGYADDGKLTKKEKGIAYATAWKAKKAGNLEEATEFGDTIKNSAATMKKAKLAKLKESRVMEETDYFYEKVGKALAGKNPNLDTAGSDFVAAVRKEMIAQGIEPNRARNILMMDEDFLSDVATSYDHCCKEMQPEGVLPNAPLDDSARELDEIAALAGMARIAAPAMASSLTDSEHIEETPAYNITAQDDEDERRLEHYNELISAGMDPDDAEVIAFNDEGDEDLDEVTAPPMATPGKTPAAKATGMAPAKGNVPPTPTFNEADMSEGNEFSGALAAAKAKGEKEFEVDGKRYTVKEDINVSITANGQEDALNLFRKLAGMDEVETTVIPATPKMPQDLETALAQGVVEPVEEERDIEYVNTPNEKIAPISASIPNGTDLHRSKMQDPATANRAANPLRKEQQVEENLWKSYESMLADVKAK